MRKTFRAAVLVLAAALFSVVESHERVSTTLTWHGDIGRIVDANCVRCHRDGGRAPMPLTSYDEARPWAAAIREELLTGRMPKWPLAPGYEPLVNDGGIPPFERELLIRWIDGGAPEGKPGEAARYVPPPPFDPWAATVLWADGCDYVIPRDGRVQSVSVQGVAPRTRIGVALYPVGAGPIPLLEYEAFDPAFYAPLTFVRPVQVDAGARIAAHPASAGCRLTVALMEPGP